jgi:capsular exopolysaccharide synthesis family protein
LIEDKYSHFSETVAGLRNLLDSPRYEAVSRCMLVISTQPGEGKTITSTSLAISYAQTGRKVLHVDFDLRRPRLAKVFDLNLTEENSFSHFLSRDKASDFQSLVNKTEVECLDVIASLPPDNVNPASIMGSHILVEFFQWARANYSRIIVDSPPFGIVGDVVTLSGLVDSVIILCCPEKSHFKPIQHCSRTLREAGATILGVLVNDVEVGSYGNAFNETGSRYGYGYGGYGGYGGYRAYGDHRSYQPYAPTETKEKIDSEEDDDESVNSEVGSESSDDKSVVEEKKAAEVESSSDYADED